MAVWTSLVFLLTKVLGKFECSAYFQDPIFRVSEYK